MGKKNKKQTQKKQQAKALKRRAVQKENKKVSNLMKAKRKTPGMPGVPGGIPPQMRAVAEHLMTFSMPIFELAKPQTPGQINALAAIIQNWWAAFEVQDTEERAKMLATLEPAYVSQPWAKLPFDELTEILLKRHISLVPKSHTEEELSRFSPEELEAAMNITFDDDSEDDATEAEIAEVVEAETETVAAEKPASDIEPLSREIPLEKTLSRDVIFATADAEAIETLQTLGKSLKTDYQNIDFIDSENPLLKQLAEFQQQAGIQFLDTIAKNGAPAAVVKSLKNGITPFHRDFLGEYHQSSLLNTQPDQFEEYLMDYYIRKVTRTAESDAYLLDGFKHFWTFLNALELVDDIAPLLECIEDIRDEFEEEIQES